MSFVRTVSLSRHCLPAFAAVGVFWGSFHAYTPELKVAIGAGDAFFGLVLLCVAAGALPAMALAPRFEVATGRFGMAIAALFLAAAFQIAPRADGPLVFAIGLFLAGAGSGLLDVVMNARLSRVEAASDQSLMNLNHGFYSLAYAISALITAPLRASGAELASVLLGLLLVVVAASFMMVEPPEPPAEIDRSTPDAPAIGWWRMPVALCGGAIVFAAFLSENAIEGWSALHVERTLGGSVLQGALGPAMLGLMMAAGRFGGQAAVARLTPESVVQIAAFLAASGALLAAMAVAPWMAFAGFGMLGLGVSVLAPMALALVGARVSPAARASAISGAVILGYCGFFVGPAVMGGISELFGLRFSFVAVALCLLSVPLAQAVILRAPLAARRPAE